MWALAKVVCRRVPLGPELCSPTRTQSGNQYQAVDKRPVRVPITASEAYDGHERIWLVQNKDATRAHPAAASHVDFLRDFWYNAQTSSRPDHKDSIEHVLSSKSVKITPTRSSVYLSLGCTRGATPRPGVESSPW